jgi:hypothetical protein
MEQPLLTYGLYEGNELKHVAAVDNGMACNCICAHCKHPLVAKNNPNNKKIAHFAHKSGKECDGAIETALHLLAKIVLSKTKKLKLPLYHYDYNSHNEASVFPNDDTFVVNKELIFDEVLLETSVTIDGETFIPDAIGRCGDKNFYIEFANTHFVGNNKKTKIRNSETNCIEIDLCKQIADENKLLILFNSDTPFKYWLSNPELDNMYKEYQKKLQPHDTYKMGFHKDNGKSEQPRIDKYRRESVYDSKFRLYSSAKHYGDYDLLILEDGKYFDCPLGRVIK